MKIRLVKAIKKSILIAEKHENESDWGKQSNNRL